MIHRARAFGLMLVAAAIGTSSALAQKVDFSGQKITLAISTPSGGGYDLYGRLVARHLGKHLPGNPTVVPQNMPGAGSLIAANWLYNVAPRDGTAFAIIPSATLFENLLGNTQARFDARKFHWLISLNDYTAVTIVWHDSPFFTARDLLTKELLAGANAPASDTATWPLLLNSLIGSRIKVVKGYAGTAGIALALERGEVQGMLGDDWASIKANKAAWLRDKKIRVLLQMTAQKHPDLQDIPTVGELASNEENRRALQLFVARQQYGRPFVAPPGVPEPVIAAYHEAFRQLVADPEFIREADQAQLIIKVATAQEVTAMVDAIHAYPKPVIERATTILRTISE